MKYHRRLETEPNRASQQGPYAYERKTVNQQGRRIVYGGTVKRSSYPSGAGLSPYRKDDRYRNVKHYRNIVAYATESKR